MIWWNIKPVNSIFYLRIHYNTQFLLHLWPKLMIVAPFSQLSSTRREFCLPEEMFFSVLRCFYYPKWETGRYWQLVGRGEGRCETPYKSQLPQQRVSWSKMSIGLRQVKNPCPKHSYFPNIEVFNSVFNM